MSSSVNNLQDLKMTRLSLKLIYSVLLFLMYIKYSTTLERCYSNFDCDGGLSICCKITKMCVSKISNCRQKCQEDSDCRLGECCDSNNRCSETRCSKENKIGWLFIIGVVGAVVLFGIGLPISCVCLCKRYGCCNHASGGGGYYGGYGGGGGGGYGGGGGDGGGGC